MTKDMQREQHYPYRYQHKGRSDRTISVQFTFDGRTINAYKGESVSAALLANGVHLMGRSFKYHRPRGVMSAGAEEANALLCFDRQKSGDSPFMTPNMRATMLEVFEGLSVRTQNRWPSVSFDMGAFTNVLGMFFPAGFYNKTFMWPKSFWEKLYEPIIRRMAGLGPAPRLADVDSYASTYGHCEVLIIGAGPAGLARALEEVKKAQKAKTSPRIMVVDEHSEMGGDLLSNPQARIQNLPAWEWLEQTLKTLEESKNVTLLPRTTAFGCYHDNYVALAERITDHMTAPLADMPRERLHRIRTQKLILATGALERPLVFAGNDKPGIMLAGAARTYLHRYGVAFARQACVFTSHDSAYAAAFDLADAGVEISAIIDTRENIDESLIRGANLRNISMHLGSSIAKTTGHLHLKSVYVGSIGRNMLTAPFRRIACDGLLVCGGFTPVVHLFSHAKGRLRWDENLGASLPDCAPDLSHNGQEIECIGACNGHFALSDALQSGCQATTTYELADNGIGTQGKVVQVLPRAKGKQKAFVDFQNDVTDKDIALAVREGFSSIEHVKRYTTTGMATDQGKTSNVNAVQIAAALLDKPTHELGLTTFRPPYTPVSFGTIAGHRLDAHFEITRKTPIDKWAKDNQAVFEPVSLWRRAWYFPKENETMSEAVRRECYATRQSVGIFDASTLGKIEIVGADAAIFMERMYTNAWQKLGVGRCRYGVMLGEDGYIMDDGVIGRLAEDRFHVTTTSGGAARVLAMMEDYLQTEWPDLNVWLTSTTEQWAVIALNGPKARALIAPFVEGVDLSLEALPHMAVVNGHICGVPMRLFRVSFTGELGFEINIPAHYGRQVWETLYKAGEIYNITPYGTETMHVLRAEKGFIIVGQDTDGTCTPDDMGLAWAIGKKKLDFVGKRSLARPDLCGENKQFPRKQFVGLLTKDKDFVLPEGAQIVAKSKQTMPMKMIGHVTSSYYSPNVGRSIALAVIENGRSLMGSSVYVPLEGKVQEVNIVAPVFYDEKGENLNAI